MSKEDLAAIVEYPDNFQSELKQVFCHTQPVERGVKMVTEASLSIADVQQRHGSIRAKIFSRSSMPKFDSKAQFNVNAI